MRADNRSAYQQSLLEAQYVQYHDHMGTDSPSRNILSYHNLYIFAVSMGSSQGQAIQKLQGIQEELASPLLAALLTLLPLGYSGRTEESPAVASAS